LLYVFVFKQQMSTEPILRVAINAPLAKPFDYLPPSSGGSPPPRPGCRVLVPFGRRQQIGMILTHEARSELPTSRLRRALSTIDREAILGESDLWLVRFTSDYYHHPVGEVVAAALPALLRQGRPLNPVVQRIAITSDGAAQSMSAIAKKAPRQAELLGLLRSHGNEGVSSDQLADAIPGWGRLRKNLLDKSWIRLFESPSEAGFQAHSGKPTDGPALNADQSKAVEMLRRQPGFHVSVLDGVTGSGKTEVYLHLMKDILDASRQVLVLVPEIGLTPQLVSRLKERLGIEPALLHSSLPDSVRLAAWRSARNGSAPLVLGTRSAVFAPLKNPGLIVVDEEHDSSFKQHEGLRYSARDLAVAKAKHLGVPVVLGSATPSIESLQHCIEGNYSHLSLPSRAGAAVPPLMRLVDLNQNPAYDGISQPLLDAISENLRTGGQALIFLNRRGFAPTLICSNCSYIAECRRCDARMTVHAGDPKLLCHHCGASRPVETLCPECGGHFRPLGQGTERLEESLAGHFPDRSVARIDSDSTRLKDTMHKALALATKGEAQILVGTQMLSKGHHFPKLTLVGVVNADQGLFGTDFRSSERLSQSLIQVAGRAGRENRQGEVIIQTAFPNHPFWQELFRGGYERVARSILRERLAAAWPPFSRLALLRAAAHKRSDAHRFLEAARATAEAMNPGTIRILGPVRAPMERRAGRHHAQLLLQSTDRQALHRLLHALRPKLETDTTARRVRWSIDVDPIELF
jgi:primosomal protein N' (replication factor Y)